MSNLCPKNRTRLREAMTINGSGKAKRLEDDGVNNVLNENLFRLKNLNFLEITNCNALNCLDSRISKLENLTNLVLQGNRLQTVPGELGVLSKLKCLNLSCNQIETLPGNIFNDFKSLQTLNLEQNKLRSLPDMSSLSSLITFKCGSNSLNEFPSSLCDKIRKNRQLSSQSSMPVYEGGAVHLSSLDLSHNNIPSLPPSIGSLVSIRIIQLNFNQLDSIPIEIINCSKLKEIDLNNNPIKDRRLMKIIEQCKTKKVLDYLRAMSDKIADDCPGTNENGLNSLVDEEKNKPEYTIQVLSKKVDEKFSVLVSKLIADQRKIVACILHKVDLTNNKSMRKFLSIQTSKAIVHSSFEINYCLLIPELHQGICDNRQKATIATHDLKKLLPPEPTYSSKVGNDSNKIEPAITAGLNGTDRCVYFDGKVPTRIRFIPLGRANEMSALEFYRCLNDEADQYRKEKKRNNISGIHKYIHLLKGKQLYPVLSDFRENVLSVPPLTNSEYSKIEPETVSVFVEVTGQSVLICRQVMNELIHSFLTASITDENGISKNIFADNCMYIEPVHVEAAESRQLIVKYPTRIDLDFSDVQVLFE
ncbi:Leucine-rich repeat-containing protein 47 [Sarcoptes scabiei]|uniref:Leucine-rich repeat-containing protein 47 n=1 Tax=Sarcoptes scabiei TaxID=52283 RepID=A0A834VHD8_SARSC|nr:Leucine-rich repeat-containing protein 47 [Sarcoptes scabiei]